jgi:xylulose-5-phosphate/fructose-6-phosphate phosphoketolase
MKLSPEEIHKINGYWRAANYLAAAQIYLLDNPLLKEPLQLQHIKARLLGHWGTSPGLNFIYAHMNRAICAHDLNILFMCGPGHGAPAFLANVYLEGTYSEVYPEITQDEKGLKKFFKQFSFPGGIPSHAAPETPGSIHEGGELGYVIAHSYGAVFDNPNLIACCVVGDGEAETGPLACSWHSNKFLCPKNDGAVLPILHLNQYKIANPTYLARISQDELEKLFIGYGYEPYFVEGSDPETMHDLMAETTDHVLSKIWAIQKTARENNDLTRPIWPMIILRTPKGWTGPKYVDGKKIENSWRAHQVPVTDFQEHPEHLKILEDWLKSYRIEELLDSQGRLKEELQKLAPKGKRRMGMNPHANGGQLLVDLALPDLNSFALEIEGHGKTVAESARCLGKYLEEVMRRNLASKNFRVFGPDETASNRLGDLFNATGKAFDATVLPTDENLSPEGHVMEVLSEHLCEGWLEGYLLTGRHGFFSCYEAFIHVIDSMFNQHAKWLKTSNRIPWRRPIASLNYFLTSHVWRQDHNGFSHQDPGFIDHVINKKAEIIRVYLPPDANSLISVVDHCLRSKQYVNLIVAGKQPALQYMSMEEAIPHCTKGIGVWTWASAEDEPDLVMACAGDIPSLEILAAADILRTKLPALKIRVVNVVDLMVLQPDYVHPHGLSDEEYCTYFSCDKPVLFGYHGYPTLIHKLTYNRPNHQNLHVHGFKEEGTTTTPFDMTVLNELDRYHLVLNAIGRISIDERKRLEIEALMSEKLAAHKKYIREYGQDMPEVRDWKWPY